MSADQEGREIVRAKVEALLPREEALALSEILERYGIMPTLSVQDGGLVYLTANHDADDED